jgi:hypothetical protein
LFIEDFDFVTWNRSSDTSWKRWEYCLKIFQIQNICRDRPSCLSLPPSIVDENMREMFVNPMNCIWIASFSNKAESSYGLCIILFNKKSIIIIFLDNSDTCWSHVKTSNFVLFANSPNNSGIRGNWLSFEKDNFSNSNKRTINNE